MIYYLYDGSYAGFLTCVFERFERRDQQVFPVVENEYIPSFFDGSLAVVSQKEKAERVLLGLRKKLSQRETADFFRVFLSEDSKARQAAFELICQVFEENTDILMNYGNEKVLYFSQTLKKVSRERHRMKAFVRFKKSSDGMFYAMVDPDFNVLPLIADFFRKRYADQPWLIYDTKRNYGLLYNLAEVAEVRLSPVEKNALTEASSITLDEEDEHFQQLWKQYFKSTNIEARRNMKLHLQYLPRRYWKYLPEKRE
ncbi:TIGR03915 family putative DNA repair protein [Weeksellaceae bacterium A-14]